MRNICLVFFVLGGLALADGKRASNDYDQVPVTQSLTIHQINNLLIKIPQVGNNIICLNSESCASDWMKFYNYVSEKISGKSSTLEWNFQTNVNEENSKLVQEFGPVANKFLGLTKFNAAQFLNNSSDWDPDLRRMLQLASSGIVLASDAEAILEKSLSKKLESIYATAKVCPEGQTEKCASLDPELSSILRSSRVYDDILWAWKGWHDVTGPKMRGIYTEIVEVNNRGAVYSNYKDLSDHWIKDFEDENFEKNIDVLLEQIKPLYDQLHLYTRRKLRSKYGSKYPVKFDPAYIPAHLLGNMWGQTWDNIYDILVPFPKTNLVDMSKILIEKNYTARRIFEDSENFFSSLGLYNMTPTFWKYSQLTKPTNREVQCHASAWDFSNTFDFRVKMCTTINEQDFYTVHHEMGHIEYYMAYCNLPKIFRRGANSGFHEAIGDVISLSVMTLKHLKAIGIIDDDTMSYEQDINFLMKIALKNVVFIPFAYFMDKWRWDVFRGKINETNYNSKWWEMKKKYQGLASPVPRSEKDFDAGAKYHIPKFVPYARYFVSHFLQFDFLQAMCKLANHEGPLHQCDFYHSKEAGASLKNLLALGNSKHWSVALKELTGSGSMSALPLLDYFKPLQEWLIRENLKYASSD